MKSIKRIDLRVTRQRLPEIEGLALCSSRAVKAVAARLLQHHDQEVFLAFPLDTKNCPLGYVEVARGTVDHCVVHPRETFRAAVVMGASRVIVCHNHPSGDPTPSDADDAITRLLCRAGAVLGIAVLDHVIVATGAAAFSYCDMGRLPQPTSIDED